jgi:hypothetical protein
LSLPPFLFLISSKIYLFIYLFIWHLLDPLKIFRWNQD